MLQTSVEMVKPGGHGHAGAAHLGQAGAFAAEDVFHLAVAVGRAAAELVNVFFHIVASRSEFSVTISEKSAIVENSVQEVMQQREPVSPDGCVRRVHQHFVEEEIDLGRSEAMRSSCGDIDGLDAAVTR